MHSFLSRANMSHISQKEFETMGCPLRKDKISAQIQLPSNNQCPHYLNEGFMKASEFSSSLRNSYQKLQQPFRKTNTDQNGLSFIGPALRNKVLKEIKRTNNINAFKHNLKKQYLKELGKSSF